MPALAPLDSPLEFEASDVLEAELAIDGLVGDVEVVNVVLERTVEVSVEGYLVSAKPISS